MYLDCILLLFSSLSSPPLFLFPSPPPSPPPPPPSSFLMSLVEIKSSEAKFKDSILELQEIFTHFDKLGSEGLSSTITQEKLGEALRESLGLTFTEDELSDMIAAVDLNASGDVQFNEFLSMMDQARRDAELLSGGERKEDGELAEEEDEEKEKEKRRAKTLQLDAEYVMTREDIKSIFQKFDTDKDGFVSYSELNAMLQAHDEKYAEEEVHAMIHLVDPSNTGMISYQAFVRLMMAPED
jgi:calmodulin